MTLLLFDLDQTLVNTGGAGLRALNRAGHKLLSIENGMDGITPHGKTDPAIVREVLLTRLGSESVSEAQIQAFLDWYVFFLKDEVAHSEKYRVLPGVREILDELSTRPDVVLGLATGNVERGARIKLARADLNRYFSFGGFGSDSESRVELVRRAVEASGSSFPPDKIFVIGDTPLDVDAGLKAGFKTVGVGSGTFGTEQLLEAGATFAIPDFERGREAFLRGTVNPLLTSSSPPAS